MIKNGVGGGNTKTGLVFEGKTDLTTFLSKQKGYSVTEGQVFFNGELVARVFKDVEYMYLLSDWFKKPEYKDVLDYIHSVRCYYYFEYIPLYKLGLPVPEED
jgi:hypothetical protein